ncbi:four helix bundle protein [bacterium]|nr:MAG: four helix bundle protein [bacterium]
MILERFENLIAWQKARLLTRKIYEVTNEGRFARDFGLRDQIRRAAVSVMSNIAKGYEKGSAAELCHALNIARGSCGEVRSQLYVALDEGYISRPQFEELRSLSEETSRIVAGLRQSRLSPKRN